MSRAVGQTYLFFIYVSLCIFKKKYCIGEFNEQRCYRMPQKLVHIRGNKLIEVYWQNNFTYWLSDILELSPFHANKMSKGSFPEATINETKNKKLPYTMPYIVKHSVTSDILVTR
jgi:hypothetical protein